MGLAFHDHPLALLSGNVKRLTKRTEKTKTRAENYSQISGKKKRIKVDTPLIHVGK